MTQQAKHTPGPWWISSRNPMTISSANEAVIAYICLVGAVHESEQAQADARLIAAAPELLAALKFALCDANTELDPELRIILQEAVTKACNE